MDQRIRARIVRLDEPDVVVFWPAKGGEMDVDFLKDQESRNGVNTIVAGPFLSPKAHSPPSQVEFEADELKEVSKEEVGTGSRSLGKTKEREPVDRDG